jgi:hypothetical protein
LLRCAAVSARHALRRLCAGGTGASWRTFVIPENSMCNIIDAK